MFATDFDLLVFHIKRKKILDMLSQWMRSNRRVVFSVQTTFSHIQNTKQRRASTVYHLVRSYIVFCVEIVRLDL